jgi:serine protease
MKTKWMRLRGLISIVILFSLGLAPSNPVLAVETGFPGASSPLPRPFLTVDGERRRMPSGGMPSRHVDHTDRLIVKFKDSSLARAATLGSAHIQALTARAGVALTYLRAMSGNSHVFKLPRRMTHDETQAIAHKLSLDSQIEYAVPDRLMSPMMVPDDVMYPPQWHYQSPDQDNNVAGINLPAAWDITTGSANLVVGVIDTGIVNHVDLQGRTVPGYNFISDPVIAGNGIGRSADAGDLGDWVSVAESSDPASVLYMCPVTDSTWHGTHVAGTIGANTNNHYGVAGINWNSKILPVRVLGKCGGYLSDVIDGLRWAAGLSVLGVPTNSNPARVVNMSLGGYGACDPATQNAIDDVLATGTVIVVAAGNGNDYAARYTPAGCTDVVSVAAVNHAGGGAYYSNYGQDVTIAAPGGERTFYPGPLYSIWSTLNTGATSPIASPDGDTYGVHEGTSMAAPHVTGVASLLLSLHPTLTPTEVMGILQATARPFPTATGSFGGDCSTSLCGAGIVDAYRAVQAVSSNAPIIGATPLFLDFATHQGDPNPPGQSVAIANPGGGALNWRASSNASWLHVSPTSGQESGTLTVTADTSGLAPGTNHVGAITISAAGAANYPVTIPVTVKYMFNIRAPLPYPVADHAQAAVGGKVYVIGGVGGQTGIVQIYDAASDTWTIGTPKPTFAWNINAAVIDGKIYVPGGRNPFTGEILGTLEIYDPANDQWSSGASLPMPLCGLAVEAVNGKLYVMGGQNQQQGSYNTMYVYDPNANIWNRLADMEYGMAWGSSGVINGKIYLFGVHDSYGIPQLTEVYNPVTNSWLVTGPLNIPRNWPSGVVLGGKLYAIGGYRFGMESWRQDVEVYDPGTDTWSLTPLLLNVPRYALKATAVGNSIYVMGGVFSIGGPLGESSTINESYDMPVNGACGSSNGQYLSIAPIANLCSAGTASLVLGNGPWTWTCTGANGGSSANCSASVLIPKQLSVTINGTGGGSINSDPSGLINCIYPPQTGTCSTTQQINTQMTLIATPAGDSLFAGWGGACSSCAGLSCLNTLDNDKNCSATMNSRPLVRIDGPTYYPSITKAYIHLSEGQAATMLVQAVELTEVVNFDHNIPIVLKGGYNVGFSTNSGYTTLHGTMTITHGSLVVDRLIVK